MKDRISEPIAVVGLGCKFPDANNPEEFWENILSTRRSFRTIPAERLSSQYFSIDNQPDTIYTSQVAVLKDYIFDREKFKISGSSFRSADLAHWLALDVATEALKDAGIDCAKDLPILETGVFVGNTLTGEFSRANLMRVRWPYVAKVMYQQLVSRNWEEADILSFLAEFEQKYKSPFSPMSEDSLAGGLSNTIAGRICNYYNFKGGGYTVDGACSSSLLAIVNACTAISNGELKAALVGGVDLSLDPFELVGFSRAGALAKDQMLVYDHNSQGFWPGEGCGFALLMSQKEANDRGMNIYATIKGWGISSDGHGGLTRPTVEGQYLALIRAYKKADYSIDSVCYIEGHGTGTKVGDETELKTILKALNEFPLREQPLFISSVKSNIGHTKAAAGIAGFLKAILVAKNNIIPPIAGCINPHSIFNDNLTKLALPKEAVIYNQNPMRLGISAMGFGGINVHVTIEKAYNSLKKSISKRENLLLNSKQDAEIFIFSAKDNDELKAKIKSVLNFSQRISYAEMADLSYSLFNNDLALKCRVAVIASVPLELSQKLQTVNACLNRNEFDFLDLKMGIFMSSTRKKIKMGYLFPGQGNKIYPSGGIYSRRFSVVKEIYESTKGNSISTSSTSTEFAQPAIVQASLAGTKLLHHLGLKADVCIGHSLGELSALHYYDSYNAETLFKIAAVRGQLMGKCPGKGKMLSLKADVKQLANYITSREVVIAGINSVNQTVVAGKSEEVTQLQENLIRDNIPFVELKASHAFHSPLMEPAELPYRKLLDSMEITAPKGEIYSTIIRGKITHEVDIKQLLVNQLTSPVLFQNAVELANEEVDVWVEAGFGKVLSDLVAQQTAKPTFSLEMGSETLNGLLGVLSFLYINKQDFNLSAYFEDRFYRNFDLDWSVKFLANPCENEKYFTIKENISFNNLESAEADLKESLNPKVDNHKEEGIFSILAEVISKYTELPIEKIQPHNRMLDDLHLNSISVAQLVGQAAKLLGGGVTKAPTEYANATVNEICLMLEAARSSSNLNIQSEQHTLLGLDAWVKPFEIIQKQVDLKSDYLLPDKTRTCNEGLHNTDSRWHSYGSDHISYLKDQIGTVVEAIPNQGILVNLLSESEEGVIGSLVDSVKSINSKTEFYVLLQKDNLATGFVKSLFQEFPKVKFLVVTCKSVPTDFLWLAKEVKEAKPFSEVFYDADFTRYISQLSPISGTYTDKHSVQVNNSDIVLVTGGGKGITSECALALAEKTGATLVILGKSKPDKDEKLAENLLRFQRQNISYHYFSVDITNKDSVDETLEFVQKSIGPVKVILHGAGINVPVAANSLSRAKIHATLGPKVGGLQYILDGIDSSQLGLLISFGSIISEIGMKGNADYALANEWLKNLLEDWNRKNKYCRCLNIAWSVWSGTGMGENLGLLEHLIAKGIEPITIDKGKKAFLDIIYSNIPQTNIILTGRFRNISTLNLVDKNPPLLRYLEEIKAYLPEVEVVSDFNLSTINDPFIMDHCLNNRPIFPGVMGLEVMAQATTALVKRFKNFTFENISFNKPLLISEEKALRVRVLALNKNDKVELAIRSEETLFQEDHFKGECHNGFVSTPVFVDEYPSIQSTVRLDPSVDLYSNLLFQKGLFQRIISYRSITPYSCVAVSKVNDNINWFGAFYPQSLLLGDPGVRDSALHAVQVCVPDKTMIPISVKRVKIFDLKETSEVKIFAKEVFHREDLYGYNITVKNGDDSIREVWENVSFKALSDRKPAKTLPLILIQVLLQRKADELTEGIAVKIECVGNNETVDFLKRPDGRPFIDGRFHFSKSNSGELQFIVSAQGSVGCDVEQVKNLPNEEWEMMIGEARYKLADYISKESQEQFEISATRIWSAVECLKKAGESLFSPLTIESIGKQLFLLKAGKKAIISFTTIVRETGNQTVFSILINSEDERI